MTIVSQVSSNNYGQHEECAAPPDLSPFAIHANTLGPWVRTDQNRAWVMAPIQCGEPKSRRSTRRQATCALFSSFSVTPRWTVRSDTSASNLRMPLPSPKQLKSSNFGSFSRAALSRHPTTNPDTAVRPDKPYIRCARKKQYKRNPATLTTPQDMRLSQHSERPNFIWTYY